MGATRACAYGIRSAERPQGLRGYYSLYTACGHFLETRRVRLICERLARIFSPRKRSGRCTRSHGRRYWRGTGPPRRGCCRRSRPRPAGLVEEPIAGGASRDPAAPVGRLGRQSEVFGPRRRSRSPTRRWYGPVSPVSTKALAELDLGGCGRRWSRYRSARVDGRHVTGRAGSQDQRSAMSLGMQGLARSSRGRRGRGPSRPTRMPRSTLEPTRWNRAHARSILYGGGVRS